MPAHRESEIGGGQRGGVVHTVSDEQHRSAGALQSVDLGDLVGGQQPTMKTHQAQVGAPTRCRSPPTTNSASASAAQRISGSANTAPTIADLDRSGGGDGTSARAGLARVDDMRGCALLPM